MVLSKDKGNRFERQVAKVLTNLTGVEWQRVPMSGAFATVKGTKDNRFKGDIFTENKKFSNIVIECKSTKERITIDEIPNPSGRIMNWINQTKEESQGMDWILIFKGNNGRIFFLTEGLKNISLISDKLKIILTIYLNNTSYDICCIRSD